MNDDMEQRLRAEALRPRDEDFTRRVLAALPLQSSSLRAHAPRSFALATRFGLLMLLLAFAQRWYLDGSGKPDTLPGIALFFVPALAAIAYLCGPLIPLSVRRLLGRVARHR
jgi:hypothetical protein